MPTWTYSVDSFTQTNTYECIYIHVIQIDNTFCTEWPRTTTQVGSAIESMNRIKNIFGAENRAKNMLPPLFRTFRHYFFQLGKMTIVPQPVWGPWAFHINHPSFSPKLLGMLRGWKIARAKQEGTTGYAGQKHHSPYTHIKRMFCIPSWTHAIWLTSYAITFYTKTYMYKQPDTVNPTISGINFIS